MIICWFNSCFQFCFNSAFQFFFQKKSFCHFEFNWECMQDYIYFIIWIWTFKNPFHINILWELLNLEMNNSTVNFTTPETSTNYTTQSIASLKWLEIFLDSICFLFGLPTHSYVIWIIVRGTGSGVASEFFNLNLSVCEITNSLTDLISALSVNFSSLLTLSIFFQGVSITGRPLFQCWALPGSGSSCNLSEVQTSQI